MLKVYWAIKLGYLPEWIKELVFNKTGCHKHQNFPWVIINVWTYGGVDCAACNRAST